MKVCERERERERPQKISSISSTAVSCQGSILAYNDCPLGSRFPYISSNGEPLTVTRRVPLVTQELLAFPEHQSSRLCFSGVRVAQSLVFCVLIGIYLFFLLTFFIGSLYCLPFFGSLHCLSVLCVIVLSALLRITASGYPFNIFKLFFQALEDITKCSGYSIHANYFIHITPPDYSRFMWDPYCSVFSCFVQCFVDQCLFCYFSFGL